MKAVVSERVQEAMHEGVVSCSVETPLRSVAALMARHRIHCVVVSDRHLALAYAAGKIDERTAGDSAASSPLLTIGADDDLRHAAHLLAEHGNSHLVVVDRASGRRVGVLSTLDLARSIASSSA